MVPSVRLPRPEQVALENKLRMHGESMQTCAFMLRQNAMQPTWGYRRAAQVPRQTALPVTEN